MQQYAPFIAWILSCKKTVGFEHTYNVMYSSLSYKAMAD
jgi:hypothetical protein